MAIQFHNHPGLVVYLTIGDPDLETSKKIALAAIDAGADVLELGVPFSDPLADGPVIQRASERAVRNGTRMEDVLALAASLRKQRPSVGLVIFSYLNPICEWALSRLQQRPKSWRGRRPGHGLDRRGVGGVSRYPEKTSSAADFSRRAHQS